MYGSFVEMYSKETRKFGNPGVAEGKCCSDAKERYISAKEPCILEKETYILMSQMLHIDMHTRKARVAAMRV